MNSKYQHPQFITIWLMVHSIHVHICKTSYDNIYFLFKTHLFKNNQKYNTLKECKETYINSVITA
jgi:hypothetical protein